MASPITPPRGMRDFLPAEKARREHALGVIRRSFAAHGFDEIETPVVEDIERLHSGLGGDNEKLSFSILKRGLDGDDLTAAIDSGDLLSLADLGLRFDLTVPLARFYATHRAELPPVFRSIQIAPVWRAERPQKGRYRQFVQCDIDIIGEATQLAEVELITATAAALEALGLSDCTIRINDRRILNGLLEYCGFDETRWPQVLISIDKLDKIGAEGVVAELAEGGADSAAVLGGILADLEPHLADGGVALTVEAITGILPEGMDTDAVADLEALAHALDTLPPGVALRFDPTLVRGMGYYTGTIFEIAHPGSGSSVGGGGRYDGMIGRFLGTDVPAAGFSIGFERVVDLIELPEDASAESVVLVYDPAVPLDRLVAIKSELIARGQRVRLDRRAKNLKAVLDRAASAGFRSFAFVNADTADAAALEVKPLN
ncbi:histidyl-tRNA synthetase [Leifsonia sp. 98AMF]|uniref:histidine--tRNA ligase n=1 Tax=unclassified Leifsonia TaxID=2663824 RepID=UPI00087CF04D|nr:MULTISPECIES: histidine--tRNA ligase [unclassified Leifsonia]SDH48169.1 histidyl-tRNA synthetase [Leifsonia sp. 197AMF]SDI89474.1 histidyl-tRNA synthetase [Leifsonia sp. 466MF]SDJ91135.1 histidyl-tRNA synthetase [Leifsonia sp. 157MF]SDN93173.1 histidyl-tRNA synthetase [Leifsonia sp. 509MF]SEN12586.1 histidyl-tRNA synthetase [Leifsonia sp. 467MF]